MKTLFKTLVILFTLSALISCEHTDDGASGSFEAELTGVTASLIFNNINNELSITPENAKKNGSYSFTYNSNGKGFYSINSANIPENEPFPLPLENLSTTLVYEAQELGENKVTLTITNDKGYSVTREQIYTITTQTTDFDFDILHSGESLNLEKVNEIEISISQTTNENLTYMLTIDSSSQGAVIDWQRNFHGLPFKDGGFAKGNFTLKYIPLALEDQTIIVTLAASNGESKTKKLNVSVIDDE